MACKGGGGNSGSVLISKESISSLVMLGCIWLMGCMVR